MIQVADYVFPTSRFRMVAEDSHEFVADFDVQTFGNGKWPVVATIGPKGTTWSVYEKQALYIRAEREEGGDGSVEAYKSGSGLGTIALPASLGDTERWVFDETGVANYCPSKDAPVEVGTFVYKNAVWLAPHNGDTVIANGDDVLYWLEQYSENYGDGDVVYERLHVYERGVGMVAYLDTAWPGGPKWVVRQ